MNALVQTLLHPLQHAPTQAALHAQQNPLRREGWPPLSVPTGTHRRASDAVPWHADGPYDPWKRPSAPGI